MVGENIAQEFTLKEIDKIINFSIEEIKKAELIKKNLKSFVRF